MKLITTISRIFVGVLFIISGFIKANDPLGFSYKLDEYFLVFHMPWMSSISLFLAMFICVFEIAFGVAALIGYRMRMTAWLLMLMIVFFTFLTFYSAYFDVVKDCGCFGDALHLKPWESFGKDIFLLVFISVLFFRRWDIKPLFSESMGRMGFYSSVVASTAFTWYCYTHLPIKDFRPFAIGKNISEGMTLPPGAITDSTVMVFIYEKDGQRKEFSMDQIGDLDSTYKFVDRLDKKIREGDKASIHDFSITDPAGGDHTKEILETDDYVFMLVAYDLNKTNEAVQKKINAFVEDCNKRGILFIGLTATAANETDVFRHEHNSMFDYYFCDGTALKTIIRSNPGLVLLKKGTVIDMWHYNDFPEFEKVNSTYLKK